MLSHYRMVRPSNSWLAVNRGKAVEWSSISQEEVKSLQFASSNGKDNPYADILAAVEKGPVRVNVSEDKKLQSLKWGLQRAIKRAGAKITIATLADKSGVVLTKQAAEPPKK